MVKKTDGTVPSDGAMSMAARDFKKEREQRGRKKGCKATSKAEDKLIMKAFNKMRPPGSKGVPRETTERERERERERDAHKTTTEKER